MTKRVLAGMRATGRLHLGNYLGGAKGMLELQDNPEYETLYMVADMHGVTTPYDVENLTKNRREMILDYLAIGLDPEKSIIFAQSEIGLHGELAFYLSSIVTVARMQHLPTYKDKKAQYPDHVTMALLNYPVLMAADILLYKASLVPVGIDQEPHLEVAREITRKMNAEYGLDFPEPQRFKTKGEYVPSLTGEGKMSKSVEGSYISLTDNLETIRAKIAKVPTATKSGGEMSDGVKLLFKLIDLFIPNDSRAKELENMFSNGTLKFSDLKNYVSEIVFAELKSIQERRKDLEAKPEYIDEVLKNGAQKARKIAQETIDEVKQKMGLQ